MKAVVYPLQYKNQMDYQEFLNNLFNQDQEPDPNLVEEALSNIPKNSDPNELLNSLLNEGIPNSELIQEALSNIPENGDQNKDNSSTYNSSTDIDTFMNSLFEGTDFFLVEDALLNLDRAKNPNSDNSTVSVLNDEVTNSNNNNWSLPNVEVTNGNNHCWMAALLSVLILLPGCKEMLNELFGIKLNQKWGPAMYNTINSKLQSAEVTCDQERDSTNRGNPEILLIYLASICKQKSSNEINFHSLVTKDADYLLGLISNPTIKGIVYHDGNMSSNISMNIDQNVSHWKSIIKNPNGGWHNFDSLNGGYDHDHCLSITNKKDVVELLGKRILIIY